MKLVLNPVKLWILLAEEDSGHLHSTTFLFVALSCYCSWEGLAGPITQAIGLSTFGGTESTAD